MYSRYSLTSRSRVMSTPRSLPTPRPLPAFVQLRFGARLHRRLEALVRVGAGRGDHRRRERPLDERRVHEPHPVPEILLQHLQDDFRRENRAAEVHEDQDLVGVEALYGFPYAVRVRTEGAFAVASDRRHLHLPGHLADEIRGAFGDLGAVRDEHEADHATPPTRARRRRATNTSSASPGPCAPAPSPRGSSPGPASRSAVPSPRPPLRPRSRRLGRPRPAPCPSRPPPSQPPPRVRGRLPSSYPPPRPCRAASPRPAPLRGLLRRLRPTALPCRRRRLRRAGKPCRRAGRRRRRPCR